MNLVKSAIRVLLVIVILTGVFGVMYASTTGIVRASSGLSYTVDVTTAVGGVYARYGPHTNDTNSVDGYGAYPDDQVLLLCGVTDGDPVGQYNNTTWHFVEDLNNTGEGDFWINDHYLDTPNPPSQLTPGESQCPNESSNPLQQYNSLPCTPLLLIGARGSGEAYSQDSGGTTGFGPMLAVVASDLKAYYESNLTTYGLPYPAVNANLETTTGPGGEYFNSVEQGEELLTGIIMNQSNACPQQMIDLIGYSQGAEVVNNTASDLNPDLRTHLGGVVTFGDPEFNAHNSEDIGTFDPSYNGIIGPRPELPQDMLDKAQSYCDQGDAICNTDRTSVFGGNYGHSQYQGIDAIEGAWFFELLHPAGSL